jgi:hypothetical protein
MADILLKCPGCAKVITAAAGQAGKRIECPHCHQRVPVLREGIRFSCPSCQQSFVAAPELAMCDSTCPGCNRMLHIPICGEKTEPPRRTAPRQSIGIGQVVLKLGGLLIFVALIVWGVQHRQELFGMATRNASPAPAAPVTALTNAVTPAAAPLPSDDKGLAAFPAYADALRTGDFATAAAQLADLRKTFATPEAESAYWQKVIPDGRLRELVLYSPCEQCTSGACVRCTGKGQCPECNGLAVCPLCKGEAPKDQVCTACVCAPCAGSGKCAACKGAGKRSCPDCEGAGEIKKKADNPCPYCSGKGFKPGLKKADGTFSESKCVRCRGTGLMTGIARTACGNCSGKGTLSCQDCGGGGKCPSCAGRGRRATCQACGGTGAGRCVKCEGGNKCLVCLGSGKCPDCQGRGACRTCDGHGAVVHHTFAADRAWLRRGVGYIAWDDVNGQIAASGGSTGKAEVTLGTHLITIAVASQQVACISSSTSFAWCKRQVLVK